jgi:hypothetical protein
MRGRSWVKRSRETKEMKEEEQESEEQEPEEQEVWHEAEEGTCVTRESLMWLHDLK